MGRRWTPGSTPGRRRPRCGGRPGAQGRALLRAGPGDVAACRRRCRARRRTIRSRSAWSARAAGLGPARGGARRGVRRGQPGPPPRRCGCSASTRTRCTACSPRLGRDCDRSRPRPPRRAGRPGRRPAGGGRPAARHRRRASTPPGRCVSLHPDLHRPRTTAAGRASHAHPPEPGVDPHGPARRAGTPAGAPADRHRRAGRLRQDRAGRRAVPRAGRRAAAGRRDQRHLHDRGRRLPAAQRRCCRPSGSARWRPAAARTPRSATTSRPTSTPSRTWRPTLGPARPGPGRERRRQPDRHVQPGPGRPADLRARRGRRRQGAAQGRPRGDHAPTCWSSTRPTWRRWSAPTSAVMDRDASGPPGRPAHRVPLAGRGPRPPRRSPTGSARWWARARDPPAPGPRRWPLRPAGPGGTRPCAGRCGRRPPTGGLDAGPRADRRRGRWPRRHPARRPARRVAAAAAPDRAGVTGPARPFTWSAARPGRYPATTCAWTSRSAPGANSTSAASPPARLARRAGLPASRLTIPAKVAGDAALAARTDDRRRRL